MVENILAYLGKKMYDTKNIKIYRRYAIFRLRCALHRQQVRELLDFFAATPVREQVLLATPAFLDQMTRQFFYKGSTWEERKNIICNHVTLMEEYLGEEFLQKLYVEKKRITLWEDVYEEQPLSIDFWYNNGQRKEGCLSLVLHYQEKDLFQIMFWLTRDEQGQPQLYIGALQGPKDGTEIIKGLTKAFYGYRPKNLLFYGLRVMADCWGIKEIHAVCNAGHYAMNHLRLDRKVKVNLATFWEECEGKLSEDPRFYLLPVAESRKTMAELKPSKRAQHRRRFAKMDELAAQFKQSLQYYQQK